ncbi:MAG: pyruvate kinase [Fimbriimonadaceae bacterium]|jgi:pyruvate kinase|nr:pyruvate kinase [Fimbriimonadaceae bacterium]
MRRRTKIVCTLGPAVDNRDVLAALIEAGMNVARLNCSHGDWDTRRRWVKWIRELSPGIAPIAILVDLQGPKFRIGEVPGGLMTVAAGQTLTVGPQEATIPIIQPEVLKELDSNCRLLLGDGNVELKLGRQLGANFEAKAVSGGTVRSRQGITIVGRTFECSCLTDKDRADIKEAAACDVDYIALSYVHHALDVEELRREVDQYDTEIRLCAKIETRAAVKEIDDIAKAVDLVMVARGDLGLQMEIEEVPIAQKRIIEHSTRLGKPVITATQMLESMISNPRPTRAEATDVANAILDGTDALMLSAETAAGQYPIECVKTMVRIAEHTEPYFDRTRIENDFHERATHSITHTEAVAHSVVDLSQFIKPRAIITTTTSGQTSRLVSKFRPRAPILCVTWSTKVQAQMAVVWGVTAALIPAPENTDDAIKHALEVFVSAKRLKTGDLAVLTAGVPVGVAGHTNLILTKVV